MPLKFGTKFTRQIFNPMFTKKLPTILLKFKFSLFFRIVEKFLKEILFPTTQFFHWIRIGKILELFKSGRKDTLYLYIKKSN